MPKISVILPVYNGEKYLSESIESIINQSFIDWELIIVDDCSSDNSIGIIHNYIIKDNRIKLIRNGTNQKLPKSLNNGFANAQGMYLTWTSDDNLYDVDAFKIMSEYLDDNKNEMLVCAKNDYISDDSTYMSIEMKGYDNKLMCKRNCVGACFMYRREIIESIGGYNPEFFLAEDYEYWLRILFKYKNIGYIDRTLYHYRFHPMSLTMTRKKDIRVVDAKVHKKYIGEICEFLENDPDLLCEIYFKIVATIGYDKEVYDIVRKYIQEINIVRNELVKNEMCYIFGAGNIGKKLAKNKKNYVIAFIDSDFSKVGTYIDGIQVLSIDELKNKEQIPNIILASSINCTYSMLCTLYSNDIKKCFVNMDYWE